MDFGAYKMLVRHLGLHKIQTNFAGSDSEGGSAQLCTVCITWTLEKQQPKTNS